MPQKLFFTSLSKNFLSDFSLTLSAKRGKISYPGTAKRGGFSHPFQG